MLFKVTLLVLNFITASYKQRYFPFYDRNEENPTFGALTELRSCARNLGVNIVKFSTGINHTKSESLRKIWNRTCVWITASLAGTYKWSIFYWAVNLRISTFVISNIYGYILVSSILELWSVSDFTIFYPYQSDYWFCRNTSENKSDNYYENLLLRVKKDSLLQQRDAASKRCVPCQKEHILVSKRVR